MIDRDKLIAERTRCGFTQRELAEHSGVSLRTIQNLERGVTTRARPGTLRKLGTALGNKYSCHKILVYHPIHDYGIGSDRWFEEGGERELEYQRTGRVSIEAIQDIWRIAEVQRRTCLPADKPVWDGIYQQASTELEQREAQRKRDRFFGPRENEGYQPWNLPPRRMMNTQDVIIIPGPDADPS